MGRLKSVDTADAVDRKVFDFDLFQDVLDFGTSRLFFILALAGWIFFLPCSSFAILPVPAAPGSQWQGLGTGSHSQAQTQRPRICR